MSKSIIKAVLILAGVGLLIYVGIQWYDFNNGINALKDSPFGDIAMRMGEEKFSEIQTRLVMEVVVALVLLFFGASMEEEKS